MQVKIPPFPGSCGKGYPAKFPTEGINLCRVYNIKEGDSLSSIAVKFGSTVADLVALNPEFTDPNLLQPGKQIKIPVGWRAAGASKDIWGLLGLQCM